MSLHKPTFDWRLQPHYPDSLDLLSETDFKRYRLQRRLIGPIYQSSNLKKFEQAVDGVIRRAIVQIKNLEGIEVDLKEWMHILAVECLGAIVLSWSPGFLRDKSDRGTSSHGYLAWKRRSVFGLFPAAVLAESVSGSFGRAFAGVWGLTYLSPAGFKPFFSVSCLAIENCPSQAPRLRQIQAVQRRIARRLASALGENPPKDSRNDLLADLIQLHRQKPKFTKTYLKRMAVTNFGAGHETMCSALTSAVAMIGSHPQAKQGVADEVRSLENSATCATGLSYTQACINEALRLHPVIGMSLSRKVPAEGLRLHGYYFPPGTVVGCNPVSLHRNEEMFGPQADSFIPDRWLDETDARAMERCSLTYGGGARTCPGRHLAELVVHKVVPALFKEFDIEISMPPEEKICYYFVAMLTDVKVRFHQRDPVSNSGMSSDAK